MGRKRSTWMERDDYSVDSVIVKYACISVDAPVNTRNGQESEEMRRFGDYLNDCAKKIERGRKVEI